MTSFFKPNGCSFAPDFDIGMFCNLHDYHYSQGGTKKMRKKADLLLRENIAKKGTLLHILIAWIYYFSVRMFGRFFFHFTDKQN